MAGHQAGDPLECYGIPIVLHKDPERDEHGNPIFDEKGQPRYRCGFKVGGGIDQDPQQSPQGYLDNGIYVTYIYENGPAHRAGLQVHDKLLQVNGVDMTMLTHKKACDYIRKKPVLNLLVDRKGVPQMQKPMPIQQPQFQQFQQPPSGGFRQQYSPAPASPSMQYRPY